MQWWGVLTVTHCASNRDTSQGTAGVTAFFSLSHGLCCLILSLILCVPLLPSWLPLWPSQSPMSPEVVYSAPDSRVSTPVPCAPTAKPHPSLQSAIAGWPPGSHCQCPYKQETPAVAPAELRPVYHPTCDLEGMRRPSGYSFPRFWPCVFPGFCLSIKLQPFPMAAGFITHL